MFKGSKAQVSLETVNFCGFGLHGSVLFLGSMERPGCRMREAQCRGGVSIRKTEQEDQEIKALGVQRSSWGDVHEDQN